MQDESELLEMMHTHILPTFHLNKYGEMYHFTMEKTDLMFVVKRDVTWFCVGNDFRRGRHSRIKRCGKNVRDNVEEAI